MRKLVCDTAGLTETSGTGEERLAEVIVVDVDSLHKRGVLVNIFTSRFCHFRVSNSSLSCEY